MLVQPFCEVLCLGSQIIHLSDTTYFTLSIRMDKTATEVKTGRPGRCMFQICEMARARVRYTSTKEPLQLVEVKSNGGCFRRSKSNPSQFCLEKRIFSPNEISVPTLIGLNSKLYVVYKDEIDLLVC